MLGAAVAILLWLLPLQVNGLITASAKCLSGYQWTFSSIGQSPCDIAAELAAVCVGRFDLAPLSTGLLYGGPTASNQNSCRCSSVYYSLLSACSYCQGQVYLEWSIYETNCTTPYLAVFIEQIPDGVKVPAYAYQDVSVSNSFNLTLAQSTGGVESTRVLQPSSSTTPRSSVTPTQGNSSKSGTTTTNNTPAIIGGVVGGIVGLGLIAALITFLMLRSKQKTQKYNSSFQLHPSTIHSMSPPPGSPGRTMVQNPDDRGIDPNFYDSSRPLSQSVTGSSAQPHGMTRTSHYSGMPEF